MKLTFDILYVCLTFQMYQLQVISMNKKPRQVLPLLVNVPVVERIIIPQNRIVCFHHAVMMKVYLV